MALATFSLLVEINFATRNLSTEGSVIIYWSLNKLKRKGFIAFKLSGPPKLKRTTAIFFLFLVISSFS